MTQVSPEAIEESVIRLAVPKKYNVVMLNDNVTPMDFVIQVLMAIFRHDQEKAKELMIEVHEKGRSIVGTYSYEVAEQKSTETVTEASRSGYPLDVIIEESE